MAAAMAWLRLANVPSPSPVRPSSVYTLTNTRLVPSSSTTNGVTARIFMSGGSSEVVAEPAKDPLEEVDAVLGQTAGPEEQVRAGRVARELGLAPSVAERDEHLLALADRAAVVRLAVDHQGRCPGAVGERRRRMGG